MRTPLLFAILLLCDFAEAQSRFTPPIAAATALEGVNFNGQPVGEKFRSRFSECDTKNTCDGKTLKYGCSSDRNRNSALLRLKGGTIFYDGKMGLDADGSPYSQKTPGKTDQPQTSLRYELPGRPSINADRVPFIVIPLGGFDSALGVQVGDVAAVVYNGKRVFAVVADQGPVCKIGEGSIQLHEMLDHSVCKERASNGDCLKLRNAGIERGVLYFIFPGTRKELYPGLTAENINARVESIGAKAWDQLRSP
jgi:glycosyl hydrolase group 75 (putative chitosanase)